MVFNPQPKDKRVVDQVYIDWIKSLDSVGNAGPGGDAHHIIGFGLSGAALTPDDYFAIPLSRGEHILLHRDPKKWERENNHQIPLCMFILGKARDENKISEQIFQKYYYKCLKAWDKIK